LGIRDPDPGGQQLPKKEEKVKKFQVSTCWMFYFEAEGFSSSLDTMDSLYLYEGLSKFEFLITKKTEQIFRCIFFNFWSSESWIQKRIRVRNDRIQTLDLPMLHVARKGEFMEN
jgi:hypothetical protein